MESWLISERGKKLSINIAESTCRRWSVSVSRWECSTKTLHYAPSESGSRRKTFAEIRWKKRFGLCLKMGRKWLYRGRISKERDGKLGINIDHVTKHSRIDVREESSIFSVLYQPASASMKSARDISLMSTNLDARRTQQVSFMLLFSCLWSLMGSIQYVNNMIKQKAHSRVCVCMLAAVACMNGRDDDDDHVYNFVHCDEML